MGFVDDVLEISTLHPFPFSIFFRPILRTEFLPRSHTGWKHESPGVRSDEGKLSERYSDVVFALDFLNLATHDYFLT